MSIYRFKQFMWAILSHFEEIDEDILYRYLSRKEIDVFKKLQKSEQQHSIRVCKDALIECNNWNNINKSKLAKVALLHDLGKIEKKLTIIDKSVIVILDKITRGNLSKCTFIKKVDVYYNHPKKSLKILNDLYVYDTEFLEAIEQHHCKGITSNCYLQIIKKCDNNN